MVSKLNQIIILWSNKSKDVAIGYKPILGYLSMLLSTNKVIDKLPSTYFDSVVLNNEDKKAILLNNPMGFFNKFWVLHNPDTYKKFFVVENEVSTRMPFTAPNTTNFVLDNERGI